MSVGHFYDAGGYVDHGDASVLFPVESLSGRVHRHRDAQVKLDETDSGDVLVVSPVGLASSYSLARHPLTVVEIDSLSREVRSSIAHLADVDISAFDVVQIGRNRPSFQNRSLNEF